jgi:fructose-1-phosphate kinase PfkB-like protein
MILTLTPNPSLDLLFSAERLVWEDANRLPAPRRRPGGQGINLARAARELGGQAVAVAPLGGRTRPGRSLRRGLRRRRAPARGGRRLRSARAQPTRGAAALGHGLAGVDAAGRAARELLAFGCVAACVALGAKGAVLATREGVWHARPPGLDTGSAVGAGDAFLAALLLRLERDDPESALVAAVAAGSAVLRSAGRSILDADAASRIAGLVRIARIGGRG